MAAEAAVAAATPSIYYVFSNSDGVGKAIVIILLLSSVFCLFKSVSCIQLFAAP